MFICYLMDYFIKTTSMFSIAMRDGNGGKGCPCHFTEKAPGMLLPIYNAGNSLPHNS